MKRLSIDRQVAGTIIALALLAGCGGTVTPTAAVSPIGRNGERGSSRTTTSSQNLMYVIRGHKHGAAVYMFSYPKDQRVGTLSGLTRPTGLCSDSNGNVFATEDGEVLEYAHGATIPIQTLSAIGNFCAWDPSTGDLAVVGQGKVQIFSNARGSPQVYANSEVHGSCIYDNGGNLFIDGLNATAQPVLIRFANKQFMTITLSTRLSYMDDLQWDGKYLVIDDFYQSGTLYRVAISGSRGTIEGSTSLNGEFYGNQAWLQGKTFLSSVVTGRNRYREISYWSYPGGKLIKKFKPKGGGPISSITVSVAPSH